MNKHFFFIEEAMFLLRGDETQKIIITYIRD